MPTLLQVLAIRPGAVVALVGAGGKTTTLQRLVGELRAAGRSVLTTSTVHLFELKGAAPHPFVVEPDPARLRALLPPLLAEWGHVRVAGERLRADKIRGLTPEAVDALRGLPGLDVLLVEADGARHRSLKAPAAHEPVLPPAPDLLLIVAGLDILGAPLTADHVHRVDAVAALSGLPLGAPLTPAAVAAVLTHPQGGLKDVPPGTRCWLVGTKLAPATARAGGELAAEALQVAGGRLEGVILLGAGAAPLAVVRA